MRAIGNHSASPVAAAVRLSSGGLQIRILGALRWWPCRPGPLASARHRTHDHLLHQSGYSSDEMFAISIGQISPYRSLYSVWAIASEWCSQVRCRLSISEGRETCRVANMPRSSSSRLICDTRRLIEERHPLFRCDGCLALHFGVSLAAARAAALKVASEPGFQRHNAVCERCNRKLELTTMRLRRRS